VEVDEFRNFLVDRRKSLANAINEYMKDIGGNYIKTTN